MNKKITLYMILITILLMLLSCAVNNNTSLIKIYNLSDKEISNFKIGNTYIFSVLKSGEVHDYWASIIVTGTIYGDNIDVVRAKKLIDDDISETSFTIQKDNSECIFMTNYEYHIDILNDVDGITAYINAGISPGKNTDYHYPAN
ncbi:MAG: hypothetical protein A2015_10340 [Spirochaetes bacterium GWF1_31_7]|nr:MAG: hypothetical protein A2Y30_05975 [Spirochaetes bacterium GWE1_32_154]OHD49533.1 MAG: hypothetical protein A2Y29_02035 [Spirochaetes bacterium GWE2_31_10]OHD49725.1 MAG: hypothetical protein A2015_10340 [Spirochaetes bacterium GWF1_31_7]OHD79645.1 MAG: hypothetical protein A2355_08165 [Spirochaetes bacterium RIFOXYB1_FULL_32_8]HBD95676.1 hypothetical protein [Spirochaetia bacterium]